MHAFLFGFSLGFSLILAIGAQNAFVLKQGLKNEHVFLVCLICALSDALLILAGVSGFHILVSAQPGIVALARYGGVLPELAGEFLTRMADGARVEAVRIGVDGDGRFTYDLT